MEAHPQCHEEWVEYIEQTVGATSRFQRFLVRGFKLDLAGTHGVDHWLRVYRNGIHLAESTDANKDVIKWFALLHDACRLSNGEDIDHGPRAAALAWEHKREIELNEPYSRIKKRDFRSG
jgi:HD superfamily phosphodiesterase